MTTLNSAKSELTDLAVALGGRNAEHGPARILFNLDDVVVEANAKDGATRLRIRANLGYAERALVETWTARQPQPASGQLQIVNHEDGSAEPRLVFERPVRDNDWPVDPMGAEIHAYATAWENDDVVQPGLAPAGSYAVRDDPRDLDPSSAWLLIGDHAAFPDPEELANLRDESSAGIFDCLWTAAKQTVVGDLALIYFMAPIKAVHFVARAASSAFFARDVKVNADVEVADEQTWAYFTALIAIKPIPFRAVQEACDGHLILRGRSGKFLRPETISALTFIATNPDEQEELDRIVATPVGLADLPHPSSIDLDLWVDIAAGALPLEAQVETYIVEPLLRNLLPDVDVDWSRQYRIATGVVDYLLTRAGQTIAAIEVKLAMPAPPSGDWSATAEFRQIRRYIDELQVPGLLIDAHRVMLIAPGAPGPSNDIQRRTADSGDFKAIREHILGV